MPIIFLGMYLFFNLVVSTAWAQSSCIELFSNPKPAFAAGGEKGSRLLNRILSRENHWIEHSLKDVLGVNDDVTLAELKKRKDLLLNKEIWERKSAEDRSRIKNPHYGMAVWKAFEIYLDPELRREYLRLLEGGAKPSEIRIFYPTKQELWSLPLSQVDRQSLENQLLGDYEDPLGGADYLYKRRNYQILDGYSFKLPKYPDREDYSNVSFASPDFFISSFVFLARSMSISAAIAYLYEAYHETPGTGNYVNNGITRYLLDTFVQNNPNLKELQTVLEFSGRRLDDDRLWIKFDYFLVEKIERDGSYEDVFKTTDIACYFNFNRSLQHKLSRIIDVSSPRVTKEIAARTIARRVLYLREDYYYKSRDVDVYTHQFGRGKSRQEIISEFASILIEDPLFSEWISKIARELFENTDTL